MKREDLSAPGYAGNKVRPLEVVFGEMGRRGLGELWATGAYGSNHALAAAIHAARLGVRSGSILWPQPWSQTAHDNLEATISVSDEVRFVGSVVTMASTALGVSRSRAAWVMPPGAATPLGALGHAGAALEVAHQLAELGASVDTIVLPVGSTCTTVGLLVGTALAHACGLMPYLPSIAAVRVTPWPVTDPRRIAWMAARTALLLRKTFAEARLELDAGPGLTGHLSADYRAFARRLEVVGDELGDGYGHPTPRAWHALATFSHAGVRLDTTYSAKAAAHLLGRAPDERLLFWATKSAHPLPAPCADRLEAVPVAVRRWLRRA